MNRANTEVLDPLGSNTGLRDISFTLEEVSPKGITNWRHPCKVKSDHPPPHYIKVCCDWLTGCHAPSEVYCDWLLTVGFSVRTPSRVNAAAPFPRSVVSEELKVRWEMRQSRGGGVSMERHQNARVGEVGDSRENPLASGIVQHDSHMRKSVSDQAGNRARSGSPFAARLHGFCLPRYTLLALRPVVVIIITSVANKSHCSSRNKASRYSMRTHDFSCDQQRAHERIEHTWDKQKTAVDSRPQPPETLPDLITAAQVEWDLLAEDYINTLMTSMPRRVRDIEHIWNYFPYTERGGTVVTLDSHSGGRGFDSRSAHPDFDPRENPLAGGIVRHGSHMRKSGSDLSGNRIRFAWVYKANNLLVVHCKVSTFESPAEDRLVYMGLVTLFARRSNETVKLLEKPVLYGRVLTAAPRQPLRRSDVQCREDRTHAEARSFTYERVCLELLRNCQSLHRSWWEGAQLSPRVSRGSATAARALPRHVATEQRFRGHLITKTIHYRPKNNWAPVYNVCSVVVTPLESRRATSCSYNNSHPVWYTLYECLQDIHGDSSLFLLQSFHELSNGFWPHLTHPHPAIQFIPKLSYRVEVGALGGPAQPANIVVGDHLLPATTNRTPESRYRAQAGFSHVGSEADGNTDGFSRVVPTSLAISYPVAVTSPLVNRRRG
ncbi:hypothetical protein PR048_009878 [Dryococelus australis]|uniref:C2 domain-containing protein n=1 Tax=Dryococelus australis TaxID=614101 RepID=A0ABQ9I161_9NEOP|nr:hypothetical protein PR048_009878 [Dryococelus australis]